MVDSQFPIAKKG